MTVLNFLSVIITLLYCYKGECPGSWGVLIFESEVAMMSVTSNGSEEGRKEGREGGGKYGKTLTLGESG